MNLALEGAASVRRREVCRWRHPLKCSRTESQLCRPASPLVRRIPRWQL